MRVLAVVVIGEYLIMTHMCVIGRVLRSDTVIQKREGLDFPRVDPGLRKFI